MIYTIRKTSLDTFIRNHNTELFLKESNNFFDNV